ncbi:hypothetical protein SeMB42_g04657 [Synchytrium endobioticum]|uniref:Uncharacterized protein n=1 Tax=Synchytrium endobioticum TaxID=286115 RepID=A0A507CWT6_9FUNG|nr:hypothetical protein SeMB42_g04657 [Synchytrium endobioticum]
MVSWKTEHIHNSIYHTLLCASIHVCANCGPLPWESELGLFLVKVRKGQQTHRPHEIINSNSLGGTTRYGRNPFPMTCRPPSSRTTTQDQGSTATMKNVFRGLRNGQYCLAMPRWSYPGTATLVEVAQTMCHEGIDPLS